MWEKLLGIEILTITLVLSLPERTNDNLLFIVTRLELGSIVFWCRMVKLYLLPPDNLKFTRENYPNHDIELALVIICFKDMAYIYLYYVDVNVFTNHKNLQYVFSQKKLNLRQRKRLELLKDYDMNFLYHSNKANVVANAFNRLSMRRTINFKKGK